MLNKHTKTLEEDQMSKFMVDSKKDTAKDDESPSEIEDPKYYEDESPYKKSET